jgi:hypothetical protein
MKKIIKVLIYLVLIAVSLFLLAYFHELTHKYDFRNVEKTDDYICVWFGCSPYIAYYYANYDPEDEEVLNVKEYTERHAIIVSIIWLILSSIILGYIGYKMEIDEIFKKNEKEEDFNDLR